ncbi:MAG: PAS domain-containing protein, partial [Oceanococcus sp.]
MNNSLTKSSTGFTAWALMPIGAAIALALGGALYGLAQMPLSGFFIWSAMTLAAVVVGSITLRQRGVAAHNNAEQASEEMRSIREALARAEADQSDKSHVIDLEGQVTAINRSQAVIEFGLDGTILHANENFLAAVDYDLDVIVGQHHSIFVDPNESASPEYAAFWQRLGRGEFDAGQYKRIGRMGKEIWIQASYNPVLDSEGRPFKVVKFATDITAQVKANASVQDAVEQTSKVVAAASQGDLSQRIDITHSDGPMRDLCQGINQMLDNIAEGQEREAEVAQDNLRIKNALDNVTTNVMIADNDRQIIYLNESVEQMMRDAESDIQKDLPNFKVDALRGGNIDVFHKNPDHQIKMLEALQQPHRTEILVGGRTFGLIASPVLDADGTRLGTVVEWKD